MAYKDSRGYDREHSNLIHRQIAYSEIYLKNRKHFPLPFSKYVVHHINGKKGDFSVKNLYICTKEQHNAIHDKQKEELRKFKNKREIGRFLTNLNKPVKKEQKKVPRYEPIPPRKTTKKERTRAKRKPLSKGWATFWILTSLFILVYFTLAVIVERGPSQNFEEWLAQTNHSEKMANVDLYTLFDKVSCGMSVEKMIKIFGEDYNVIGWSSTEQPDPYDEHLIPSGFLYYNGRHKIILNGQYYSDIGRVALHQVSLYDSKTDEIIKKMSKCYPRIFEED